MGILRSNKLVGVVFLALLAGGVWLTGAIFTKAFADYDRVTLQTESIGLQMPQRADVKIRGVIVGEVLGFESSTDGATMTLGLYPDSSELVPANVTARILPKTLFGEKYVSLEVPEDPAPQPIQAGATITQTDQAAEVEQVLNDLYPLLRAVQPAQINLTLNAIATALEGRGDRLGDNFERLDSYLKQMNPLIPEFVENLRALGQTSDLYADVVPELATMLRNQVRTGQTLVSREDKLNRLFKDVAAFSGTMETFLAENGDNLVRVNELGAEQLRVFAKYAPEFPCLAQGIVNAGKLQAEAFRGFTLHINLEILENQPRPYGVQDLPVYGEQRGPTCASLPNPPYDQKNIAPFPPMDDGVEQGTNKGTSRVAPGFEGVVTAPGTLDEQRAVRGLLAASWAVPATEVSDLSVLLLSPLVRGGEVTLR